MRGNVPPGMRYPNGMRQLGAASSPVPMVVQQGQGVQQPSQDVLTDWFTYLAAFGNIAPLATLSASLQIQADSDFQLIKLTRFGTLNGGSAPFSDGTLLECSVFITDNGSGRQLMNSAVPIDEICGNGKLPFVLPESRIFKANATIQIQVQNFSSANTYNNVSIAFCGRKIWDLGT